MSSNQSVLDALAQEGFPMTEERLVAAMEETRSNGNGAIPTQTKVRVAYNYSFSPTTTNGHTKPINGHPHRGLAQPRPAVSASPRPSGAQLVTPRGRQRTPKPWLMEVLCRLGMHGGQWAYVAEGNCSQGRECGRCGSVHLCAKHRREWGYKLEGSCLQIHFCARCADVNKRRTQHEKWGPTYSVDSETDAHNCIRCGEVNSWSTASDGD